METVHWLLEHGADPNAVARDDVMPLSLAMQLQSSTQKDKIISALQIKYSIYYSLWFKIFVEVREVPGGERVI